MEKKTIKRKTIKWSPMTAKEEAEIKEFIVWLYEGFNKWGLDVNNENGNKYADHIFYLAVRDITRMIGESKNLHISQNAIDLLKLPDGWDYSAVKKARKKHSREIVEEHTAPAKEFFDEFWTKKTEGKDFTLADANEWFKKTMIALITKKEDNELTRLGYQKNRPNPMKAYKEAGIVTTSVTSRKKDAKK